MRDCTHGERVQFYNMISKSSADTASYLSQVEDLAAQFQQYDDRLKALEADCREMRTEHDFRHRAQTQVVEQLTKQAQNMKEIVETHDKKLDAHKQVATAAHRAAAKTQSSLKRFFSQMQSACTESDDELESVDIDALERAAVGTGAKQASRTENHGDSASNSLLKAFCRANNMRATRDMYDKDADVLLSDLDIDDLSQDQLARWRESLPNFKTPAGVELRRMNAFLTASKEAYIVFDHGKSFQGKWSLTVFGKRKIVDGKKNALLHNFRASFNNMPDAIKYREYVLSLLQAKVIWVKSPWLKFKEMKRKQKKSRPKSPVVWNYYLEWGHAPATRM